MARATSGSRAASAFANPESRRAFADAIRTVEERSAAEVVVAVRHHSGSYLHANALVGIACALATSAFLLFSPFEFSLASIWLDPFAVGGGAAALTQWLPTLRRWLTPQSGRRRRVSEAARAEFFAKGVRMTRARTGLLVYVSLLERMVEVVADTGVSDAVDDATWQRARVSLESALVTALRNRQDGRPVAAARLPCLPHLSPCSKAKNINTMLIAFRS